MRLKFLILLLCSLNSFSQIGFDFEKEIVSRNDLETNTFDKDSTAHALVIYEYGNTYVDKHDFKLKTVFKQKLKILDKRGFDKANIVIHLYNSKSKKEVIKNIVATTYNIVDGKVTKTVLKENEIYREQYDDNHTLVKFAMPNIKEGSVISYSYKLSSPFVFKFKGWEFQDDIPKLYSQYDTSIPANYEYNIKLVGTLKLFKNTSKLKRDCLSTGGGAYADCTENIYIMKDIPAFIDEGHMTTKDNYLSRVDYELKTFKGFDGRVEHYTKTWKTVDKELRTDASIGKQLKKSSIIRNLLPSNIVEEPDSLNKAKAIYKYVQSNYTWNEKFNIFRDVSVKNLLKNKSGNVSEINILLHNLLAEHGIKAKAVLLSTRKNGLPTKLYPVISDFNYLIVQITIGEKKYLLDATDEYLPFGQVAFRALNQFGRVLDFKNGSYWEAIKPKLSTIQYKGDLKLDADGSLSGNITSKRTGYHALKFKKAYYQDPDNYVNLLQENGQDIEVEDHKVLSSGRDSDEFTEEFNIFASADGIGDKVYLDPFLFKFFTENPFNLQERTYPIDFGYKDTYLYNFKIQIPENYEVVEIPEDATNNLPNNKGKLWMKSKKEGDQVFIYFKIVFKEAIYPPQYYASLKAFMSRIINLQTKSLFVLKKK